MEHLTYCIENMAVSDINDEMDSDFNKDMEMNKDIYNKNLTYLLFEFDYNIYDRGDKNENAEKIMKIIDDTTVYNITSDGKIRMGIPNRYCSKYYDDEDFIYSKIKFSNNFIEGINLDVVELMNSMNYKLDYSIINTQFNQLYIKIINIYNYVILYYNDLSHLSHKERILQLPTDILYWIDNIIKILRDVLDNNELKYPYYNVSNAYMDEKLFAELLFGLNIIIINLKIIVNYYKSSGIWNMEDIHIPKFMRLLNNMSIIFIYIISCYSETHIFDDDCNNETCSDNVNNTCNMIDDMKI
jgi:hypothetical protein